MYGFWDRGGERCTYRGERFSYREDSRDVRPSSGCPSLADPARKHDPGPSPSQLGPPGFFPIRTAVHVRSCPRGLPLGRNAGRTVEFLGRAETARGRS
ncbi:MAG: hypothetical protein ACR2RF_18885 [Geminicoccaceae bacterium]